MGAARRVQKFRWVASTVAFVGLLLAASSALAAKGRVALTFDDVPGLTNLADQAYVDYLNDSLLRRLRRHHIRAIGFVNAGKLDELQRDAQIVNLEKWLSAGMELGNHTFSHGSPNALGAKGYIQDIARGEPVIRALLKARGKPLVWFRHPYLETGFPLATKREIDNWLAAHGYRVAPVTIDAEDWEFAEPYDDAIARHDEARRVRIKAQYLAYTERTVAWYQSASNALFGRQIAFVMLLHDTRLNADCFDDLARILHRRKLKAVSLETAMKDPAYRLGDPYVGRDGIDWLERWSNALHKPLPWASWQDPPADIVREYNALNNDQL
jgi:peptidoglycan/xylan/chitin deacetylase (PgdA/CDA1 family)